MKVSLWRQFSSNHSGSFTVVGTFESPEKANAAAHNLREIIRVIREWHEQHPDHVVDPIPPEEAFTRQYGVKWDVAVDWYEDESPVKILYDNLVVLHAPDTWSYPLPFLGILKQLGGSVVYNFEFGEPLAEFHVKLICVAPDEETASKLAERILAYLPEPWALRTPWYRDELNDYDLGAEGTLRQLGNALSFDLKFGKLTTGLPALIHYLEAHGCTRIEYEFVQGLEVDF
jgi:hypothetical protein